MPMSSSSGVVTDQKWRWAAVTRPLPSVGGMCDAGNCVVVGPGGWIVLNLLASEVTPCIKENGVYLLDMWTLAAISAVPASGLQRPRQR